MNMLFRAIVFILVLRNYDFILYFFEVLREYVRVLNVIKLERVFVKSFFVFLDGYRDGVNCLVKYLKSLVIVFFGVCDGEVS